ncbi:MAG: hypothetical protein ACI8UG_001373 [Gammaproteobacteria bacterium]|jgi:hypothetical protein
MNKYIQLVTTYLRLGIFNIIRVLCYRLKVKSGFLKRQLPIELAIQGEFFVVNYETRFDTVKETTDTPITFTLFGWINIQADQPPNWHQSVLNNKIHLGPHKHWTEISDFNSGVGDIKGVWEMSRFQWVLSFCLKYESTKDKKWLEKTNLWLSNWSLKNPLNQGANWKCAQEASLRVLHLAAAALIMKNLTPNPTMRRFVRQHLQRIQPTLGYAKAQDNNHGTSEGAALFVGGSWLLLADEKDKEAKKWMEIGRQYLQERVSRLIADDGTFSQYSVTYHRLMLDSLSFVELWRRETLLQEFSATYLQSLKMATCWLLNMIDTSSGDAPNLGANDGALILNFTGVGYRDFRPSTELASQLFLEKKVFETEHCQLLRSIFCLDAKQSFVWPNSKKLASGGYGILRNEQSFCMLTVPSYRFRPSQADILHLDFWLDGINILRDAGSFSYNTESKWLDYFSGCQAHNTVQFDQQQPMPKISRFLYGQWPASETFKVGENEDDVFMQSSYSNDRKQRHIRSVLLGRGKLTVSDSIKGGNQNAVLRWRLPVDDWTIDKQRVSAGNIIIQISSNNEDGVLSLEQGFESRFYGQKDNIPVLHYSVDGDADITTIISWK